MKRTIILFIVLLLATVAYSQKNMNIEPMFKGEGKWNLKFSATYIEGTSLEPYNLTLFRSISTSDFRLYGEMKQLVEIDSKEAVDKECGYINGELYYGFYQLKPVNDRYRYIFYRNSSLRKDEPNELTVVYMEGYPSLAELKQMFK